MAIQLSQVRGQGLIDTRLTNHEWSSGFTAMHEHDEHDSEHEDDSVSSFSFNSWGSFHHLPPDPDVPDGHNDMNDMCNDMGPGTATNEVPEHDTDDFEYEDLPPDDDAHVNLGEGDVTDGVSGGETADHADDVSGPHQNGDHRHDPGRWNSEADGAAGPPPEFRTFWGPGGSDDSSDSSDDETGAAPAASGSMPLPHQPYQHVDIHQNFHYHHHHYHRHNHYKSKTVQKFYGGNNRHKFSASQQHDDWGKRLRNSGTLHETASGGVIDLSDAESEQSDDSEQPESESDHDPDPVMEPPFKSHRTVS